MYVCTENEKFFLENNEKKTMAVNTILFAL